MKIINEKVNINSLIREAKISIDERGFYIAKNLLNKEIYLNARKDSLIYFDQLKKTSGILNYPLRGNVSAGMKDVIGLCKNSSWYLYRSSFFTWNRPNTQVSNIIRISRYLSSIRNLIKGNKKDFGKYIEDDDSIGYTSLSNYPKDGGFLREHKDGTESNILHFKVELTHKGLDYKNGGFYIYEKLTNKKVDISRLINPCDVAFFDGSQAHGIDPIYGEKGRHAFFEIPTKVNKGSRYHIYSNDGWSLTKRAFFKGQLLITPQLKKLTNNILELLP